MTEPQTKPLVAVVDPKLSYIISQVESSGFSGALRFEPKVYETVKGRGANAHFVPEIASLNHCTVETAEVIYSTSFGLYQIMGYNLYRLGLHRPVSEFQNGVQSRVLQDTAFARFLSDRNILFTVEEMRADPAKLVRFAEHYNGSEAYADRMRQVANSHYGVNTL